MNLYNAHYWVVEFHPRTADIRLLDSVPLYVSFSTYFSPSSRPTRRHSRGFTLPRHSTPLHSTRSLHSTPPLLLDTSPTLTPTLTPNPSLPLTPFSSPPSSQCYPAPITAETPLLLAAEWITHRGPESVASQYTE